MTRPRHPFSRLGARTLLVVATFGLLGLGPSVPSAKHGDPAIPDVSQALAKPNPPQIAVLSYHSVTDDPDARFESVTPDSLRAHIVRLRQNGWTFLSLSEVLAHRDRPAELPPRTVVLTFDDGYLDFYDNAMPILRQEQVPAALAVITAFVSKPPPDIAPLMSWDQIREVDRSGLVEVISHTHAVHRWVPCNPYGYNSTSVGTRLYLLNERRYEDRNEYRTRMRADLEESQRVLAVELGRPVAALVWPYGEHNEMVRVLARQEGYQATLGLNGGTVDPGQLRDGFIPRVMVLRDMVVGAEDLHWLHPPRMIVRAVDVDMDALYSADSTQFESRVAAVVQQAQSLGANTVILDACPDPGPDGRLRDAWFVNHQIPVRADIFSMVATRFAHERIRVWVRAPSLKLFWDVRPAWHLASHARELQAAGFRVSPDSLELRRAVRDFYTDLAVYLPIYGMVFDDDAFIPQGERPRHNLSEAATQAETSWRLLDEIQSAVRSWRPECRFGRILRVPPLDGDRLDPDVGLEWSRAHRSNEFVMVELDALALESPNLLAGWTHDLGPAIVFQLQARDPETGRWLSARELESMAQKVRHRGFRDLGVSPLAPGQGDFPAGLLEESRPNHPAGN